MNHCADCGAEIGEGTWRCAACKETVACVTSVDQKIKNGRERLMRWARECHKEDEVLLATVKDCLL